MDGYETAVPGCRLDGGLGGVEQHGDASIQAGDQAILPLIVDGSMVRWGS
jgi:hypothetical protein